MYYGLSYFSLDTHPFLLFEYVNTRRLNNLKLRGDMALDDMIDDRHELRLYSIDISATRDGACGTF